MLRAPRAISPHNQRFRRAWRRSRQRDTVRTPAAPMASADLTRARPAHSPWLTSPATSAASQQRTHAVPAPTARHQRTCTRTLSRYTIAPRDRGPSPAQGTWAPRPRGTRRADCSRSASITGHWRAAWRFVEFASNRSSEVEARTRPRVPPHSSRRVGATAARIRGRHLLILPVFWVSRLRLIVVSRSTRLESGSSTLTGSSTADHPQPRQSSTYSSKPNVGERRTGSDGVELQVGSGTLRAARAETTALSCLAAHGED